MKKKIAVLVRERQEEALRMAVGLTLADDKVTVFVMGNKLADDGNIAMSLEMLLEMGVTIYSDNPENSLALMSIADIAKKLPEFDAVVPY
jgi:predicted peroxiredoxin